MRVATRAAIIGIPFWEKRDEPEIVDRAKNEERDRVDARLKKQPANYVKVDPRGTVIAIVDGIVYYNTPSHREDELGV